MRSSQPIVADDRCRSLPTRPRPTPVSRRARSARSNCRCADGRGPRATCRSRQQCYTAVIAAARSIAGRAGQRLRTPLPPRVRDHEAHRGVPGDGAFIKTARPWHSARTFTWPGAALGFAVLPRPMAVASSSLPSRRILIFRALAFETKEKRSMIAFSMPSSAIRDRFRPCDQ